MILKTINLLVLANGINCKTGLMKPSMLAQEVDFDPNLDDSNMSEEGKQMLPNGVGEVVDQGLSVAVNSSNTMTSCLIELSKNIYNFDGLRKEGGEYTATGGKNESIYFNICEPTKTTCPDAEVVSYANLNNENNTCLHMSGQNAYN